VHVYIYNKAIDAKGIWKLEHKQLIGVVFVELVRLQV